MIEPTHFQLQALHIIHIKPGLIKKIGKTSPVDQTASSQHLSKMFPNITSDKIKIGIYVGLIYEKFLNESQNHAWIRFKHIVENYSSNNMC